MTVARTGEHRIERPGNVSPDLITVSWIVHELLRPIVATKAAIELTALTEDGISRAGRTRLERAGTELMGLSGMVRSLLESGPSSLSLECERFDVAELLREIVASLDPDNERVQLVGSPHPHVNGDRLKYRSALENVIRNALTHGPEGGRVTIALEDHREWLVILVRDTGPCLPSGHESDIFRPFVRIPTSTRAPGIGMGLYIASQVLSAHGGTISFEGSDQCIVRITVPVDPR